MLRNLFRKKRNPSDAAPELESDVAPSLADSLEASGSATAAAYAETPGPLDALDAIIRAARSVN